MLRIKKLYLQGFKSFSDPTELKFNFDGITAVVGPNGCGKSNIADAVSWVIGEQRAKSLRGGKMEDVIFQGSRNRSAAGMAEVVITLQVTEDFSINTSKLLPDENPHPIFQQSGLISSLNSADISNGSRERKQNNKIPAINFYQQGEQLTVGRRLYRTGESEYELNGKRCRLRDVQDLFSGTGLGSTHYAIIEQGRVGQVLSAKPLERRSLIEEAAGISKFKARQRTSELKLEGAKQNLSRISDILSEVQRQQNSLKRQAAKARRYQRLKENLRSLMRAIYVCDYHLINTNLDRLDKKLSEFARAEGEQAHKIIQHEEQHLLFSEKADSLDEQFYQAKEACSLIEMEIGQARQLRTHHLEQVESLLSQINEAARDQVNVNDRKNLLDQETVRLKVELQQVEQEMNTEGKLLTEEEKEFLKALSGTSEIEEKLTELRQEIYRSATQLERWSQLRRQFLDSVERCALRIKGLTVESDRANTQTETVEKNYQGLSSHREANQSILNEGELQFVVLQKRLSDQTREKDTLQAALLVLQKNLLAIENRIKTLNDIDTRRDYFSEAVQTVIQEAENAGLSKQSFGNIKVIGTLADIINVQPAYEAVIETVLHDELQYILVEGIDDALSAITFLKTSKHGRATFLVTGPAIPDVSPVTFPDPDKQSEKRTDGSSVISDVSVLQDNGQIELHSVLGIEAQFTEPFRKALPELFSAVITETVTEAIALSAHDPGRIYLSRRDGARVIAGRIIAGGSGSKEGLGVLSLKREIVELQHQFADLSIETGEREEQLSALNEQINELLNQRNLQDGELRILEKQVAVLREQFQQCERERERSVTHRRIVEAEKEQIQKELLDFEQKLEHALNELTRAQEAHTKINLETEEVQSLAAASRRESEERNAKLANRRADYVARTERRRGLQHDIRRLESEDSQLQERVSRQQFISLQAATKLSELKENLLALDHRLEELEAGYSMAVEFLKEAQDQVTDQRRQLTSLNETLRLAREDSIVLRDHRAEVEIERARQIAGLEHLIQVCRTELMEELETLAALVNLNQVQFSEPVTVSQDFTDNEETEDQTETETEGQSVFRTEGGQAVFEIDSARQQLIRLKNQIDNLGPVNLVAIAELSQIMERLEFLIIQQADIEQAIHDTQSAIQEIRRRSRESFLEAFKIINHHFTQTFNELFGGGHGEMRLIDESDVLESGIEIIAQPPGKRLQNVLLLSGGEKAMTAIALVMAIFKYRPSPFCLLDEVDAPLDEVNIGRYADKIIEMSSQTQFLIITHSKRTMEVAKTLYGVTMEDPGVSKLISVRFS